MKRFINMLAPVTAVLFFIYLLSEWAMRMFGDEPGDPLIPLMFMVLIIIGSAIFQQVSQPVMIVTPPQREPSNTQKPELN